MTRTNSEAQGHRSEAGREHEERTERWLTQLLEGAKLDGAVTLHRRYPFHTGRSGTIQKKEDFAFLDRDGRVLALLEAKNSLRDRDGEAGYRAADWKRRIPNVGYFLLGGDNCTAAEAARSADYCQHIDAVGTTSDTASKQNLGVRIIQKLKTGLAGN